MTRKKTVSKNPWRTPKISPDQLRPQTFHHYPPLSTYSYYTKLVFCYYTIRVIIFIIILGRFATIGLRKRLSTSNVEVFVSVLGRKRIVELCTVLLLRVVEQPTMMHSTVDRMPREYYRSSFAERRKSGRRFRATISCPVLLFFSYVRFELFVHIILYRARSRDQTIGIIIITRSPFRTAERTFQ